MGEVIMKLKLTLKLTLKKEWFDMIASGVKTEEYREIKPHWIRRFYDCRGFSRVKMENLDKLIRRYFESGKVYNGYKHVEFTNGYGNHRPRITMEFKYMVIGTGNPDWGAEKNKEYFVIKLGKEISRENF